MRRFEGAVSLGGWYGYTSEEISRCGASWRVMGALKGLSYA
jgi:hypothetical protein